MADVKPPEGVTYRQWQAQQTKRRIARAARRLFASGGYAETSIEAVAREAGVAARTVYASLGGKKQVLAAICDEWLAESNVSTIAGRIMSAADPRQRLELIAHLNRRQWELGQDVVPMLEAAASSDPDVARMLSVWKQQRAAMIAEAVRGIASSLRPGAAPDWTAATVRALSSPGVFDELVRGEGWSPEQYEEWLALLLAALLLPV
jgi:AcrR family transcriptional regulator